MPKSCCLESWEKIPPDEPVFTIRGQDLCALLAIEEWLFAARMKQVNPEKLRRAEEHYEAIKTFQQEHPERCKIPD